MKIPPESLSSTSETGSSRDRTSPDGSHSSHLTVDSINEAERLRKSTDEIAAQQLIQQHNHSPPSSTSPPLSHDDSENGDSDSGERDRLIQSQSTDTESFDPDAIQKQADANIQYLHWLQVIPCVIFIGGFGRLTGTSVNFFGDEHAFYDLEWEILVPTLTFFAILVDVLYYQQLHVRDKWTTDNKRDEFLQAQTEDTSGRASPKVLSNEQAKSYLTDIQAEMHDKLFADRSKDIIHVIKKDIFVQQMLIQLDIHKDGLLKRYENELNNYTAALAAYQLTRKGSEPVPPSIIDLLQEASVNISRKNYNYSHPTHEWVTEAIEYIQAIKIPLRLASVLMLCRAISPDKDMGTGMTDNEMWVMLGILCGIMLIASVEATRREFKKQKLIDEYEKGKRKIKSKHHDVLMSTLLHAINSKISNADNIIYANPARVTTKPKPTSHKWLQNPMNWRFSHAVFLKLLPSILILGSLGRRPFTFYTLSTFSDDDKEVSTQSHEAPAEDLEIVLTFVFLAAVADFLYMFYSLREEKWKLDRQEDEDYILDECKAHAEAIGTPELVISTESHQKALYDELKESNSSRPENKLYEDTHPGWALIGALFEWTQFMKFALRGMSLGFTMPRFFGKTDSLNTEYLDGMYVGMLIGAAVGLCMGLMIRNFNERRDKILCKNDKNKTQLYKAWENNRTWGEIFETWQKDFGNWISGTPDPKPPALSRTDSNGSISSTTSTKATEKDEADKRTNYTDPIFFFYKPAEARSRSSSSSLSNTLI